MGRIKHSYIRVLGDEIIKKHKKKLSTDFEKNKKVLNELMSFDSKKTRNILAGYIVTELKKEKARGF